MLKTSTFQNIAKLLTHPNISKYLPLHHIYNNHYFTNNTMNIKLFIDYIFIMLNFLKKCDDFHLFCEIERFVIKKNVLLTEMNFFISEVLL